jgi:hypothetical protein
MLTALSWSNLELIDTQVISVDGVFWGEFYRKFSIRPFYDNFVTGVTSFF